MARRSGKAQAEEWTIIFVAEAGFYLLPFVARTYAPRGKRPVLRVPLTRDHLSVISGITAAGQLLTRIRDTPFRGPAVARPLLPLPDPVIT